MTRAECFVAAGIAALLFGCSTHGGSDRGSPAMEPLVHADAAGPTEGSLWSPSSKSLFTPTLARRRGDLLTVLVIEEARSAKNASTSARREASAGAGVSAFLGFPEMIADVAPGFRPSGLVEASTKTGFVGEGDTVRSGSLNARVTVVIEDVLPGGNLAIRGSRSVQVNGETEELTLRGIVRWQDIRPDNTVLSSTIADAKITYTGDGPLGEKQRVGWLIRLMDWLWPF